MAEQKKEERRVHADKVKISVGNLPSKKNVQIQLSFVLENQFQKK